tara:strand:+ start:307 stop:441 length:135 start_codon:yes stop_codon:yes gene_type:complete
MNNYNEIINTIIVVIISRALGPKFPNNDVFGFNIENSVPFAIFA